MTGPLYWLFHLTNHITTFSQQFPIFLCRFRADLSQNQGAFEGGTNPQKSLVKLIVWYYTSLAFCLILIMLILGPNAQKSGCERSPTKRDRRTQTGLLLYIYTWLLMQEGNKIPTTFFFLPPILITLWYHWFVFVYFPVLLFNYIFFHVKEVRELCHLRRIQCVK